MTGDEYRRILQECEEIFARPPICERDRTAIIAQRLTAFEEERHRQERNRLLEPTIGRLTMEFENFAVELGGVVGDTSQPPISEIVRRYAGRFVELFTHGGIKPAFDNGTATRILEALLVGALHPSEGLSTQDAARVIVDALVNEMVFVSKMSAGYSATRECTRCHGPVEEGDNGERVICEKCELKSDVAHQSEALAASQEECESFRVALHMLSTEPAPRPGDTFAFRNGRWSWIRGGPRRTEAGDRSTPVPSNEEGPSPGRRAIEGQIHGMLSSPGGLEELARLIREDQNRRNPRRRADEHD